ncbi:uncharacterized protein METZ01_LOCUS416002, partial [marine metagenome]
MSTKIATEPTTSNIRRSMNTHFGVTGLMGAGVGDSDDCVSGACVGACNDSALMALGSSRGLSFIGGLSWFAIRENHGAEDE